MHPDGWRNEIFYGYLSVNCCSPRHKTKHEDSRINPGESIIQQIRQHSTYMKMTERETLTNCDTVDDSRGQVPLRKYFLTFPPGTVSYSQTILKAIIDYCVAY